MLCVGFAVLIALAILNPDRQAHTRELTDSSFCQYSDYFVFSTMSQASLDGTEHTVSVGTLGLIIDVAAKPRRGV